MSLDASPVKSPAPELIMCPVKFVGGSADVTKTYGEGVTVTYDDTGLVTLAWTDAQGTYRGLAGAPAFEAATPGNVKAFVGVVDTFDTSDNSIQLNLFESGSLADLAASEWCSLTLLFHRVNI